MTWDRLLHRVDRSSFQQDWAYGAIFARSKVNVSRFVVYLNSIPIGMGQIVTRRFFGILNLALLLRGPVWFGDVTDAQKKQVLLKIRQRYPLKFFNLFVFSPEEEGAAENYRAMGFRRVITGYSTVVIDLRPSPEQLWQRLYGRNRTSIRKAQKKTSDIQFGDHRHEHVGWLLAQEKKQQKGNKYQGLPAGVVNAYGHFSSAERGVLSAFTLRPGGKEPLAGVLFLCHGNTATYYIGWNGREGRKDNLLNLLLWEVMLKLKAKGIKTLDLGGINTEKGADIARFKLGFGGEVVRLSGTFM